MKLRPKSAAAHGSLIRLLRTLCRFKVIKNFIHTSEDGLVSVKTINGTIYGETKYYSE